jgi:hypothetical protein
MKQKAPEQKAPVSEDVLQQLAVELQRLAGSIKKDIKKKSTLKGLSNLTAITPIQQMLMNHLSNVLLNNDVPEQESKTQNMPGYL